MAGMFQNFMRGMGSLDDRQRAILLAMAAGGSPNPRMQAPLSAASQGLMQSIQEEANRKQREQEAAALAAARQRELEVRAEEAAATREDTAEWRKAQRIDLVRDRWERRADRRIERERQRQYDEQALDYKEQAATATRDAAAAQAERARAEAEIARKRKELFDKALAGQIDPAQLQLALQALGGNGNAGGGIAQFLSPDGMTGYPGTTPGGASPTADDILNMDIR